MACIFAVFLILYLQAESSAYRVATLPPYLPTKFHAPSSSGFLATAMKAKGKIHFAPSMLCYFNRFMVPTAVLLKFKSSGMLFSVVA